MMKKFFATGIFFLALFSFTILPHSTPLAAEIAGVEGISYLVFLSESPFTDIFSFEEGTDTFHMELREVKTEGAGTYSDHGVLFTAGWTSTDENTSYSLTGISMVSMVIIGGGEKTVISDSTTKTSEVFFIGILSTLFPD
jgi:hypothetical protein